MKNLILLILTLILATACMEKELIEDIKGEINGIVVDSSNNAVEGATVTVVNKTTTTDSIGYFSISKLNVSGDPTYQVRVTKDNFATTTQSVPFDSEIAISGSTDTVTLNDTVASVTITLEELVSVTGTLSLPSGRTIDSNDTLAIETELKFNSEYTGSITATSISGTIDSNFNFTLENIPRYGTFTDSNSSTVAAIEELIITLYLNNSSTASYRYTLENFDVTDYPITRNDSGNTIDLDECELQGLYSINGSVYTDLSQLSEAETSRTTVEDAVVILSQNNVEIDRATTDNNGEYIFTEISANTDYKLSLLALDTDNDGRDEYAAKDDFQSFEVEDSESGDKTVNLWFEETGEYSISGTLYVGNKEDIAVVNGVIGLYSADGLIEETTTDDSGNFTFSNINIEEVYLTANDLDSDSNGYINFQGYEDGDNDSLKTKISLTNTSYVDISNIELYMKVNENEPNYIFELEETNFFSVNSSGSIYNQSTLAVSDNITLTFNEEISQTTLDEITNRNTDIITLTEISSSNEIDITITLDGSDSRILIINPDSDLATSEYELSVNSELNSEIGYQYGVENSIDTDILDVVILEIE